MKPTIADIVRDLQKRPKNKPWSTAKGIAGRLSRKPSPGFSISEKKVEKMLIKKTRKGNFNDIRYSSLPSKFSLKILWGATELVKDRENLMPLYKINESEEEEELRNLLQRSGEDWPLFFISHSHRDFQKVVGLTGDLLKLEIRPWLAEEAIQKAGIITDSIIKALAACDGYVLFVTKNSLESTWTRKEFENIPDADRKNIWIVLDGADPDLLELFNQWDLNHGGFFDPRSPLIDELRGRGEEQRRRKAFLKSLGEYFRRGIDTLLVYPAPSQAGAWTNQTLPLSPKFKKLRK